MFKSILVPVDGSPFSEQALPLALMIAQRTGAVVHVALVHVPDSYDDPSEFTTHSPLDVDQETKDKEHEYLARLKERLAAVSSTPPHMHHLEGIVAETLREEVAERAIDLVVMTTHGRGFISRALLGSVTDNLIRHLTIPILLFHPPEKPVGLERASMFQRILVALDGSPLAETMLEPVAALGTKTETQVRLLRAIRPPSHFLGAPSRKVAEHDQQATDRAREEADKYLQGVAERLRGKSLQVQTHVVANPRPAAAILEEAQAQNCDLIALATHGRGGLQRLILGSVADKVIRGSSLPVLVCSPK